MLYFFLKRVLDVTLSLLGIIYLMPGFIVFVVLIKLDSPGSVFADSQNRTGKNGRVFRMYKFRSMISNAHEILKTDPKFKKLYQQYKKGSFKIKTDDDPRITRVGRFIRKTSIDELPQLLNVLKGEMSLVGPRAFHVEEFAEQKRKFPKTKKYSDQALRIKPGVTGPWQVSGRSGIDFPQRIKLDAQYAKNRSLLYDFKILIKTIPAVLSGEGN